MTGRILILEEESRLVASMVKALTKQGYEVLVNPDLESALAEVKAREFDAVMVPVPSGGKPIADVVKALRDERPDTDVVLMLPGDVVVAEGVAEALKAGAAACLPRLSDNAGAMKMAVDRVLTVRRLRREKEELRQQLEKRATEDALTGLPNRREFERRLTAEFSRADRVAMPLCLVLVDLDRYAALVDTYGKEVGDRLIVRVSDVLQTQLRPYDVRARWDVDAFALLLPAMDVSLARSVAERLRKAIERSEIEWQGSRIGCTASLGVSVYGLDNFPTAESLLEGAEDALRRAKMRGRNRTVLFTRARVPGILLVEDSPQDAEYLNALLHSEGFEVKLVHRGGEAVDIVRRGYNGWVFLSLDLQESDPVDTLQKVLQIAPGAQVVLLVSERSMGRVPKALALGPFTFLAKPFEADPVKRLMASLMAREASV